MRTLRESEKTVMHTCEFMMKNDRKSHDNGWWCRSGIYVRSKPKMQIISFSTSNFFNLVKLFACDHSEIHSGDDEKFATRPNQFINENYLSNKYSRMRVYLQRFTFFFCYFVRNWYAEVIAYEESFALYLCIDWWNAVRFIESRWISTSVAGRIL